MEKNSHISAINRSSLYAQKSKDTLSTRWSNISTLALPYGYVQSDNAIIANDDGTDFEVNQLNYVLDMRGFSGELGYDNTLTVENSADALSRGQNAGGYYASAYSNQRMAVRNKSRIDSMQVFVPELTELEIKRNGKLIYNGPLQQGVNNISYGPFDRGSYNVELIYKVNGKVIKTETRHIFNIPVFDMRMGDYDWLAQAGKYDKGLNDSNEFGEYAFAKAGVSGRWFDNTLLGGGYQNVGGKSYFSGYVESVPNQSSKPASVNTDFVDNFYYNAQLSYDIHSVVSGCEQKMMSSAVFTNAETLSSLI